MRRLLPSQYINGVLAGDRFMLSRAITLIESSLPSDIALSQEVLRGIMHATGGLHTLRMGITGVPGVGKSTFIEALGMYMVEKGHKLAVLAIDPSSQRSGGSIMGDKTRMEKLSVNPNAYIRPSAAGETLGGVARKTREAMLLCEAAGFDMILIETVGVGQSEVVVKEMTDFFLLLMLAGAGDELQGIKKGIMEMADALAITKADGANEANARRAQATYRSALQLFPAQESGWIPQVLTCAALQNKGMEALYELVIQYREQLSKNGFILHNRNKQQLHWLHSALQETLLQNFYQHHAVKECLPQIQGEVEKGSMTIQTAVQKLMNTYTMSE